MKKVLLVLAACVFVFSGLQNANAAIYNPATGHWYELVNAYEGLWGNPNGDDDRWHWRSWSVAEANAVANGGHLVTINDAAENAWLVATFRSAMVDAYNTGVFVGLYQAPGSGEPAEGWGWISGDTSSYRNWLSGREPNNVGGAENWGAMYLALNWERNGYWNDLSSPMGKFDYGEWRYGIAEYNTNPVPIPAAVWLLGSGLLGLVAMRRRFKK